MKKKLLAILAAAIGLSSKVFAQETPLTVTAPEDKPINEIKYNLTPDGSKYIKATFMNQVWVRWTEANRGSTVNGDLQDNIVDIGLRRTRLQMFGQITDHVFFYTQFGMNNFNYLTQTLGNRKLHAFFHDALGEYKVFKDNNKLKIGAGLTVTGGISRFSNPSAGTIMTGDLPIFLQTTVDQTDLFARKLSVYARGQLGKLDYRVAVSDPFPVQTNGQAAPALGENSSFNTFGHTKQYQGFFMYNFLDKEPHTMPFMAGTYLGEKTVLNLEGGLIYQKDAMAHTDNGFDPVYDDMFLWSVGAFADMPLQDNKYAFSAYAGYSNTDYGRNYIRNNGIMNPANGNNDPVNFSGAGNAFPMFGTGESIYTQVGLRLPNDLLGDQGTLMPYATFRHSSYDRLEDGVNVYNTGINWLINKHQSKITLNYQLRPEFRTAANGDIVRGGNLSTAWLQYQINF
ncbi:hypothetical protein [Pontibacter harenae]|uniref:hypothetical protein n=1 Tax=Pontibacter harenae TaxID=2894083 RepID=UPI001E46A3A6|nr:hypothetical protein [Pontibacter harenae]MCC9167292.1 hypothetical protein [Pontibacter harenae]